MRKQLSLMFTMAALLTLTIMPAKADDTVTTQTGKQPPSVMFQKPNKEKMRKEFEQRLNLTDKQKEKAKKIHQQGREQMKPIMEKMAAKNIQLQTVQNSDLSSEEKAKQIAQLKTDIKDLDKKAREMRKKNSEEFEKILNKNQKAELEKMKAEGRARFEKKHKARPPFQGLGSPNFLLKPILPPVNQE